jgi:iron complex transport system permease protein
VLFVPGVLRRSVSLAALVAILFAAVAVGIACGSVNLPLGRVLGALVHPQLRGDVTTIVWSLRVPRVLIATLVGAALGVSGSLLQSMLRNGLVDPYLTGGSAGAAFAIAVAIALNVPVPYFAGLAFVTALATTIGVAGLARRGRGVSPERLILAGIAVSSLFAGLTTLIIMLSPSAGVSLSILAWIGGSLAGHGWSDLGWAAAYAALGFAVAASVVPALNAIRLGDARAVALGVDMNRTRWLALVASSLLVAAAVSVSGVIGFVGLIVPHLVRAMCGADMRWTVPASIPAGAAIVVLADTVARSAVPPLELPIGVLLSLIGLPVFLYIAFRRREQA